jgi:hypothetical protein
VHSGSGFTEGLVERKELMPGVYLAVTIRDGHDLTCILNTTEEEVVIPVSAVRVAGLDKGELEATSARERVETGRI